MIQLNLQAFLQVQAWPAFRAHRRKERSELKLKRRPKRDLTDPEPGEFEAVMCHIARLCQLQWVQHSTTQAARAIQCQLYPRLIDGSGGPTLNSLILFRAVPSIIESIRLAVGLRASQDFQILYKDLQAQFKAHITSVMLHKSILFVGVGGEHTRYQRQILFKSLLEHCTFLGPIFSKQHTNTMTREHKGHDSALILMLWQRERSQFNRPTQQRSWCKSLAKVGISWRTGESTP